MNRVDPTLPHLGNQVFLSDGGIETYLIFHQGVELPYGAAYTLLDDEAGIRRIWTYFDKYLKTASYFSTGFILESVTWRANPDWARKVGTAPGKLEQLNRKAVDLLSEIRERYQGQVSPILISGNIGPRSDAYRPEDLMTEAEAERYHATQIAAFQRAGVDLVSGFTITNVPEAIGLTRAARTAGLPVVISFTVETDGRLPTGPTLAEAIQRVDDATAEGTAYYMVNCAHPSHLEPALTHDGRWTRRLGGLRPNASSKSHAELDEAPELDEGHPPQLGREVRTIVDRYPQIKVLGGCCGTDHRHIQEIARACLAQRSGAAARGNG